MTAAARISQADMDRAVKAAAKADRARVVLRLAKGEIEIIIGESAESDDERNDFDED
ncbi:MAG: hypothetical protein LBV50_11220 [Novosphingobium sp.]|jgi:hypothetical protein|nr:hypothetical protein [Novosphingobium sp.]